MQELACKKSWCMQELAYTRAGAARRKRMQESAMFLSTVSVSTIDRQVGWVLGYIKAQAYAQTGL